MLYLNLPIDSVERCISYANIEAFSKLNFPAKVQNPSTYTENTYQRKNQRFLPV